MTYDELCKLLPNNELDHEHMSEDDYELLIKNESELDNPNADVVEFCIAGLKKYPQYKDCEDILVYGTVLAKTPVNALTTEENYCEFACEKLRELILNGLLEHESMDKAICEALLEYEAKLDNPNKAVVKFCTVRLNKKQPKANHIFRVHRRVFVAVIAVIATLFIATITAAAFGYNILDLAKKALNIPEKTVSDFDGNDVMFSNNTRFYNSMDEMLETENLNILYPVKLPDGYCFTNFEVIKTDIGFDIWAYAAEPYIDFRILVGANINIDHYSHETNGIEYDIVKIDDNLYQAVWSDSEDYYMIVVGDEALLSEIIKNLQER